MKIVAAYRQNDSRTNERVDAVRKALSAISTTREAIVPSADLVIQAGFQMSPIVQDAMTKGIPIIILENPVWHYGDKMSTYTLAYNGLNGLGYMPEARDEYRERPNLLPWREEPGQVTVFGQVADDKSLRGADIHAWIKNVQQERPEAVLREHPVEVPSWEQDSMESFEACLGKTSEAITFSSTVGAETVIRGIPTRALHAGSFAYEVASQSLSGPLVRPERAHWIHELSWRHWQTTERLDVAWLLGGYDEARAQAEAGTYDNCNNGRSQPNDRPN